MHGEWVQNHEYEWHAQESNRSDVIYTTITYTHPNPFKRKSICWKKGVDREMQAIYIKPINTDRELEQIQFAQCKKVYMTFT